MSWQIEYDPDASKDLRKLDRSVQREILDYIGRRIGKVDDPRQFGKPLRGSRFGLWRYRLRDYRIVCQMLDKRSWYYDLRRLTDSRGNPGRERQHDHAD